MDKHPAHRKSIAHSFRHRDQVGLNAGELVCKKLPRSSVPGLHFVEDQQGPCVFALFGDEPEK